MCAKCETLVKLLNNEWVSYVDVSESLNLSYGQCKEMFEYDYQVIKVIPATPLSPKEIHTRMFLRRKGR